MNTQPQKELDLLVFNTFGFKAALDVSEIKSISMDLPDKIAELEDSRADSTPLSTVSLSRILGTDTDGEESSYVTVYLEDESKLCLTVSAMESIVHIPTEDIIPVPRLVRAHQHPFFTWGFFKQQDTLVMLITFSFIKTGDM